MLVIDASFAIDASLISNAFEHIRRNSAVAPALMWSEATSVLHEMQWRGAISKNLAAEARKDSPEPPLRTAAFRICRLARGAANEVRIVTPAEL
jgi:hypothetical protein